MAPLPSDVVMTGRLQVLGQPRQRPRRPFRVCAAACPDNHLAIALGQQPRRLRNLVRRRVRGRVHGGLQQLDVQRLRQRVGRDLDLHGTRPPGVELPERLVHRRGHVAGVHDAGRPLRHRLHRLQLVVDLVQHPPVHADEVARDLPRHQQHRRRGGVRRRQSGGRVQHAGPRHHHRRADAAARASVAVGHERRRLLVASADPADAGLVEQGVGGVVQLRARQPENHAHALPVQRLRQGLPARHLRHAILLQCSKMLLQGNLEEHARDVKEGGTGRGFIGPLCSVLCRDVFELQRRIGQWSSTEHLTTKPSLHWMMDVGCV